MAGGLRYKWTGSYIKVMTGYAGGSPLLDITAATKANPCVITVTAHGRADGDVIKITEVLGMTELNNGVYIADVLSADTIGLRDTDSTGYGTYTSGGKINAGTFSNFCELTNYNRSGGTSPDIDATSLCSTAAEYEVGLPDFGTTALSFNFAPGTTVQGALHTFYESGDTMAVQIILPNSGGSSTQLAKVQQESETAGNGGLWQGTATLRNTGRVFRY